MLRNIEYKLLVTETEHTNKRRAHDNKTQWLLNLCTRGRGCKSHYIEACMIAEATCLTSKKKHSLPMHSLTQVTT